MINVKVTEYDHDLVTAEYSEEFPTFLRAMALVHTLIKATMEDAGEGADSQLLTGRIGHRLAVATIRDPNRDVRARIDITERN